MTLYVQPSQLRRMTRRWAEESQQPQQLALGVNVSEQDDAYVLSALVPGLKAEDLNIQVLENVVSIEGEYQSAETDYLLNELPSGSFRRTLRMPTEIQAEKVEAKITDGVLTLNLPKPE
jgi:HSP20 family protein